MKSLSSTEGIHPLGLPSSVPAHCLDSHLSTHRFRTWGFAPAKNWETLVFGSSQTLPSSLSHMDQLEALTGEKPYSRSREKPSKDNPWPFQALENVSSSLCFIDSGKNPHRLSSGSLEAYLTQPQP